MNIWNSLPNWVVDVQFIDLFKVWLDRFWAQQEVMYDWTAELAGTGDRSEYVKKVIRLLALLVTSFPDEGLLYI